MYIRDCEKNVKLRKFYALASLFQTNWEKTIISRFERWKSSVLSQNSLGTIGLWY
jgi:hypothetical protein